MNPDNLFLNLFLLIAFVFPVAFSFPKEWDVFYMKLKSNKQEESEHAKYFKDILALSDEKLFNYLYKCVDVDFLHYDFLAFCIKISLVVIDRKKCANTAKDMKCILATYYMGRHFGGYINKEESYSKIEAERKNKERENTILGQRDKLEKFSGRKLDL